MKNSSYLYGKGTRTVIIVLTLMIILTVVGVSYAAWSDYLKVDSVLSAGSFSIIFTQDDGYSVAVVDAGGAQVGGGIDKGDISVSLDNRQKLARLYISNSLLLEELALPGRYLMLRYPLEMDKNSTVHSIMTYQDDFDAAAKEEIRFTADSAELLLDGREYELSVAGQSFAEPLFWDVYRRIELEKDKIIGTVFLRLRPESIDGAGNTAQVNMDVSALPLEAAELLIPGEDGTAGPLPAKIVVHYSFSVPLYIEQGR